jgi:ubiquitin
MLKLPGSLTNTLGAEPQTTEERPASCGQCVPDTAYTKACDKVGENALSALAFGVPAIVTFFVVRGMK